MINQEIYQMGVCLFFQRLIINIKLVISIHQLLLMSIQRENKQIAEVINGFIKKKGNQLNFSPQSPKVTHHQNSQLRRLPFISSNILNENKGTKNKKRPSLAQNKYAPLPFNPSDWLSERQISLSSRLFSVQQNKDGQHQKGWISPQTINFNDAIFSQTRQVNFKNEFERNISKNSNRKTIIQSSILENKANKQIKYQHFQQQKFTDPKTKFIKQSKNGVKSWSKTKNNFFLKFYKDEITIKQGPLYKIKGIKQHSRNSSLNSDRRNYNTFYQ